jgi:23S rRNA pseudouridine2605 synthase
VLARAGIASRRAAEELITAGRVRVDGKVVTELGTKVDPRGSVIEVDGKRAFAENLLYVVLHKPRNVVATMSDPEGRPTVRELIAKVPGRVYPVGRLDFATSGVLLATNDGDFAAELMHPRKAVPKTYIVKVAGTMEDGDLDAWRKGVRLEDGMTLPAKVKLVRHEEGEAAVHDRDDRDGRDGRDDRGGRGGREGRGKTWFELTITEGRNQQIRRMGDATGFRVMRLARLAFAGITSEGLPPGAWRYLTWEELTALKKEWGVPKRVVSPPAQDAKESQEARRAHEPGRHHAGGPSARPRSDADRGRPARSGRGATSSSGARGARGARGPREADPRATVADSRGGPRYGGGAPVRRDLNVTEDWGGGVKRGSSGSRDPAQAPRDDVGGRGGRTRTTGSGGGIGAHGGQGSESSYRVKGRKGW